MTVPCQSIGNGEPINGLVNRSSVGTLVGCTARSVVLDKIGNATIKAVVYSLALVINREPAVILTPQAYDQGTEVHGHKTRAE